MPQNLFSDSKDTYNPKIKITPDNLSRPNLTNGDNPPFIWPGVTTHDLGTLDKKYKPLRGYIRRLTEFYKNMGLDASSISNRKCSFQFQPETVVRNVSGNSYDTQYFFNQDPGQLTIPIPGQSTFSIKLLFNREAEVAGGKYLTGNGNLRSGFGTRPSPTIDDNKDSLYGTQAFNPSWVTKIGVLVDIMVLDAVIGQGINNETVNIIKKIAEDAAKAAKAEADKEGAAVPGATLTDRQLDAQDKREFDQAAVDFWTGKSGDNPNLGNQAFLVPTPVRIVLSNNMMVEGFVLQSAVNFHKFSKDFIPTQATVELSVQALYIGFAKKTTMLTQDLPTDENENGPDERTRTSDEIAVEKATLDGVKSLYSSVSHHKGGKDLLNYILKPDPQQNFNFTLRLSKAGSKYRIDTLGKNGGGEPSFSWTGTISIYWDSYVAGASNSRQPTRTSASGGTLTKGYPVGFEQWGTADAPLTIATGSGKIYEGIPPVAKLDSTANIDHIIGDNDTDIFGISAMEQSNWDMNLPAAISPRPFEEDKFRVKLEITITLERFGVLFPVGQKIVYDEVAPCGSDILFKNLGLTKADQT